MIQSSACIGAAVALAALSGCSSDDPAASAREADPQDRSASAGVPNFSAPPLGNEECGGQVFRGEAGTLALYILLDRSASMIGIDAPFPIEGVLPTLGRDVWTPIGTALRSFVNSSDSAGIQVGLQLFPLPADATLEVETCFADYDEPAVSIAALPENGDAILNAISMHGPPSGGTPTEPAYTGAMRYAKTWAEDHSAQKVVVVLATDGTPNHCLSSMSGVSKIADAGLNGDGPSVETYVIGIGNVEGLDRVAERGGTGEAIVVSRDPEAAGQQFLNALKTIRSEAMPCDYELPDAARAEPDHVNVEFSAPDEPRQSIPYVLGEEGCGAGGWFYDAPSDPERIVTCPETCRRISGTGGGRIDVVVGCRQVVVE